MHEWKTGQLHSGRKTGPIVKSQKQAVAIAMHEAVPGAMKARHQMRQMRSDTLPKRAR